MNERMNKHIVQVHPVENCEPNLHKVKAEQEFNTKEEADMFILRYNAQDGVGFNPNDLRQAVYLGRVNDETGELE